LPKTKGAGLSASNGSALRSLSGSAELSNITLESLVDELEETASARDWRRDRPIMICC
jgi:hypothetical protein